MSKRHSFSHEQLNQLVSDMAELCTKHGLPDFHYYTSKNSLRMGLKDTFDFMDIEYITTGGHTEWEQYGPPDYQI